MPETPPDHISITSGAVEDSERFKLRRKAGRIVPLLLDPLSRDHVIRHLDDSEEVAVWREAGRIAGRQLGIHVRTGQTSCGCADRTGEHVWVANLDARVPEDGIDAAALDRQSTSATARARTRVTKGAGSRRRGLVMAYKLLDAAQDRWRKVNSPELVAVVRAGIEFKDGNQIERWIDQSRDAA